MANIDYFTEADKPELEKVLRDVTAIDNKMSDIFELSGQRQNVIMKDKHRFEILNKVRQYFESNNTPCRHFIGSISLILNNCTVRIYREDRKTNQ